MASSLPGSERARNFTRKVVADRFLIGIESDKLRGQWIDPEAARIRLSEVAERWYSTTAPLKPKTRSGYQSLLNSRILPYLGGFQLRQIDPVVVREWVAELQEEGLSASRIRSSPQRPPRGLQHGGGRLDGHPEPCCRSQDAASRHAATPLLDGGTGRETRERNGVALRPSGAHPLLLRDPGRRGRRPQTIAL